MASNESGTHIHAIGAVAIPVADPERALAFYVGTLGCEVRRDMPLGGGSRWIEVAPAGASTTIALAPPGEVKPGVDTGIRLSTADAEADHETLHGRGIDVGDILRWPGVPPMFSLRDPDGNTLYIVQGQGRDSSGQVS
ncbi:MAG TPA: VOC family protein [Candidatus Dormibacteraeota bacterium]|nr:VOC family protein [Candidatus Dormibacteraeota bacterium]